MPVLVLHLGYVHWLRVRRAVWMSEVQGRWIGCVEERACCVLIGRETVCCSVIGELRGSTRVTAVPQLRYGRVPC